MRIFPRIAALAGMFALPRVPRWPGSLGAALDDPARVVRVLHDSAGRLWNEHPAGFVSKVDDPDGDWQYIDRYVVAAAFGELTATRPVDRDH